MNKKDFTKIHEYSKEVGRIIEDIEAIQKMIQAIQRRKDSSHLRLSIHRVKRVGYSYDRGCYITLPQGYMTSALIPTLKEALKNLQDKLKTMPPMKKVEKKHGARTR